MAEVEELTAFVGVERVSARENSFRDHEGILEGGNALLVSTVAQTIEEKYTNRFLWETQSIHTQG
jgi:hypothetical protein